MSGRRDAEGLDVFFAAARAAAPQPSAALRAAVEDDAAATLAAGLAARDSLVPAQPVAAVRGAGRREGGRGGGWLAELWRLLGGWPGLGAMSAAAATGLWVGLAAPAALLPGPFSAAAEGTLYASDLYPSLDDLMTEL
jgi:hypothetical protein